ncbi:MAG: hypothetical protein QW118_03175 [Nitrososphaerota archaeon]
MMVGFGRRVSRKISLIALFSIIVFLSKIWLPSPIDKFLIFIQALCYALANLLIGRFGGTITGMVSGLMIQFWRPAFIPFTFLFAVFYGLLIDLSILIFKVRSSSNVPTLKMIYALSTASIILGVVSMYVTVSLGVMPPIPLLYLAILIGGTLNGALAGCIASQIWNRYLLKKKL